MPDFEKPKVDAQESVEQKEQQPESAQESEGQLHVGDTVNVMTPEGKADCQIVDFKEPSPDNPDGTVIVRNPETGQDIPMDPASLYEQQQAQKAAPEQTKGKSDRLGVGQWDLQTGENLMNKEPSLEQKITDEEARKVREKENAARVARNQKILSQSVGKRDPREQAAN